MFISQFKAGSADDRSPYGDFYFKPVPMRGMLRHTADQALQLAAVLACVRVLSESFAILPIKMYTTGKTRTEVSSHWLAKLMKRPNPWQTPFEWREMMMGHLAMRGNAYNELVTDARGRVTRLIPLHPDRMKVELTSQTDEWKYRYRYTDRAGNVHTYTQGELWHLRGLSSDGILGLSPLELAAQSVGMGLAAQEYGARFFQNDATPGGGWIEYPGNFKDHDSRNTFRESWQAAQTGSNRSKVAVLEFGMKFHQLGLTNKDSQFLEARQFQVSEIARIFRVPPHKIGDLSKATFSNIEQQSLEFVIDTMTPWAERWESSIETHLLLDDDKVEPEFDFNVLLRGDQAARSTYYHNGIMDGWMVRNEARKMEKLPPLSGLDEPLRPLNMVEESEASEPPQDPNAPPQPQDPNAPPPKPGAPAPAPAAPAPPPAPPPAPAKKRRAELLASAVAARVARKEAQMVAAVGSLSELAAVYQKHRGFVASALQIDEDEAEAYCAARLAQMVSGAGAVENCERTACDQLYQLALGEQGT